MKFSHSIFYVISISISTLIQCTEKISPSYVNSSSEGGQYNVEVNSSSNFEISNPLPWVSYSKNDKKVTITVQPNTNSDRQGTIMIGKVPLKVNQLSRNNLTAPMSESNFPPSVKYNEAVTMISPSYVNASSDGGQYNVIVNSSSNFEVSNPLTWVSYSKNNLRVTITVQPNSNSDRQGTIMIGKVPLKVNQSRGDNVTAPISASSIPSSVKYNDGGVISLSVKGDNGTTLWWTIGSCSGRTIGNGNPLVTYAPTSTTTYYAHWQGDSESTTCVSVTVVVTTAPASSNGK